MGQGNDKRMYEEDFYEFDGGELFALLADLKAKGFIDDDEENKDENISKIRGGE